MTQVVSRKGAAHLGRLVLAASDYDLAGAVDVLKELAPKLHGIMVEYSTKDRIIGLSQVLNKWPRLGGGGPLLSEAAANGVLDTVNATGDLPAGTGGHSYIFLSKAALDSAGAFLGAADGTGRNAVAGTR